MKSVKELQERLEQLRATIDDAKETASKLAQDKVIDPVTAIPRQRRRYADGFRDF
ncbi:hypothetical protein [Kineosporia succinea]|uniref:Uncharacterized protein n=1 Tax=Kineosporia succinea TaxID=84632 RepID=A0ABT9NVW1_9ACTN|nr:hypothetical protein [Kineosporia succinea]MDP9824461.1 hypothetical protein [Kineosporia succinea]